MAHTVIKNNNQVYFKLYGNIDADDAINSNILQILDEKYYKLTLDISSVLCYNEFVEGFKELFTQYDLEYHNVTIKERANGK